MHSLSYVQSIQSSISQMIQSQKKANNWRTDALQLKIKTMNGLVYHLAVEPGAQVSTMQEQIQQKTGVPVPAQRLLHKAVLMQPSRLFSEYGVADEDTIQLVANMLPEQASSPSITTHRQSEVARLNALTQQNLKTKKHRYLQQRINGFNFKTNESIQVLKQAKSTIDKLIHSSNHNRDKITQPFYLEERQLSVGDWVDFRDASGMWVQAQVVGKKHSYVEVHCNGYPDRWNQWVLQSSQRIMPIRTQTVQSVESCYLSPYPQSKPQLKSVKNSEAALEKMLIELPQTIRNVAGLMQELEPDSRKNSHLPKFKYSFNEEQQEEDVAVSFKNNRSHHSPPHSIHEEEYEYDDYEGEIMQPLINGNEVKDSGEGSSVKGMAKKKSDRKIMRSNRYIQAKNSYLGYSTTKSEHEHTLNHRQQTPKKEPIGIIETKQSHPNPVTFAIPVQQEPVQKVQPVQQKETSMDIEYQARKEESIAEQVNQFSQTNLISPQVKQGQVGQNDTISNKWENISNKGEHDDGESSAKSFGSKRSDRLMDASSMKSLNINTLHTEEANKQDKSKKNIFVFDRSEAQSVKDVQINGREPMKSIHYYNQEGILEEEDSQLNEQVNQEYYLQKKKELGKKLRAAQLAPLCDRLGRMLIDLAPHLATLGYTEQAPSTLFNQSLSTFTNQGSLQSKLRNLNPASEEQQENVSHRSNKYWNFQVPVMLTPWEIMKLNKYLAEQGRETQ